MNQNVANSLPRYLEFLDKLNQEIRYAFKNKRTIPRGAVNWFDIETAAVLATVIDLCTKKETETVVLSMYELSEASHVSYQSTRTRIERLVSCGIIDTQSDWEIMGKLRKPTSITLHKHFRTAISRTAKPGVMIEAIKFFAMALYRDLTGDGIMVENEISKFDDLAKKVETEKADKTRERLAWNERSDRFLDGAARMWQVFQAKHGFGTATPNWVGDKLSPTAAKERREIVNIYQQYGGKITATAWWVFCGGQVKTDDHGKRVYDPNLPHIQFASVDRKPSQFAKHFNAIVMDGTFKTISTTGWAGDIETTFKRVFGDSLEVSPRDGKSDFDMLGYYFGQSAPTMNEVPQ